MKKCIVTLLLGFDEVRTFKDRYSIPTSTVKTWHFRPILTKKRAYNCLAFDYDYVTLFHAENLSTILEENHPKYEYCIAISLLEPIQTEPNAHNAVFQHVNGILNRIEGWHKGFKIIIRHHSFSAEDSVRFDHHLMLERFVPGSKAEGFKIKQSYDIRNFETQNSDKPFILTELAQAEKLSKEITNRTKSPISLNTLASWIDQIIPTEPNFDRALFNIANPFRITMGGCYAGLNNPDPDDLSNPNNDALILKLLKKLKMLFETSSIEIIGAMAWTFYNDWRAISFCEQYIEHEKNDDPFRDIPLPSEQDFFVKIPDEMRRYQMRQATWNPTDKKITYNPRPAQIKIGKTKLIFNPEKIDEELSSIKMGVSNMIMDMAIENASYTRISPEISDIMKYISNIMFPTSTKTKLIHALKLILENLEIKISQTNHTDQTFKNFILGTISIIKFNFINTIDVRDGEKYDLIYAQIASIVRALSSISRSKMLRPPYSQSIEKFMKNVIMLERIRVDENDKIFNMEISENKRCSMFLTKLLNGRHVENFLLNGSDGIYYAYFEPLLKFIRELETEILTPLSQSSTAANQNISSIIEDIRNISLRVDGIKHSMDLYRKKAWK